MIKPTLFADELSWAAPVEEALEKILPRRCHPHEGVLKAFGVCACRGRGWFYPEDSRPVPLSDWDYICHQVWRAMGLVEL